MSETKFTLGKCPDCGSETSLQKYTQPDNLVDWWVECTYCRMSTGRYTDRDELVATWNKRSAAPDLYEALEASKLAVAAAFQFIDNNWPANDGAATPALDELAVAGTKIDAALRKARGE